MHENVLRARKSEAKVKKVKSKQWDKTGEIVLSHVTSLPLMFAFQKKRKFFSFSISIFGIIQLAIFIWLSVVSYLQIGQPETLFQDQSIGMLTDLGVAAKFYPT